MNKEYEARIYWLTEAEGGRKMLPCGDKYAPIIRFPNSPTNSEEYWSIFVNNKVLLNHSETLSVITYLSDYAPDNLAVGVEFNLCEGKKVVARGIVVRELVLGRN